MIGAIRLFAIAFAILTLVYFWLSIRQRWRARNRLEEEFDRGDGDGDRDTYIRDGMREYEGSLRRKLILAVYIVPLLIVTTLIYVTNFM